MSRSSPWKTGGATPRRSQVTWPTLTQFLRQVLTVIVGCSLWGALLLGFLRLTDAAYEAGGEPEQTQEAVAVASPATPTQPPTATFTPTPVPPAKTPDAAVTTPAPAVANTPTSEPSVEPTETPIPPPTPETPASPTDPPTAENGSTEVSFKNDVLPILERRCVKCHGGEYQGEARTEEGLKLLSYEDVLAGSYNGPVIEPGDVENSFLIEQIVKGEMPKKEPRLLPAEIRLITAWVEAGAPDN